MNAELDAIRALLQSRPRPTRISERRARLDSLGAGYTIPPDVRTEPASAGGVPAEWTSTPTADPHRVLLFLHGGAYIAGSIRSHRHMIAEAGRQAHVRTLALDYRLAPEHPFPAAIDDALAAYRFLLSTGVDPANIALAGESAGGGLALATLISLREENTPLPARVWLSSPWTDLTNSGETMTTKSDVDPLIQRPYLMETAALYLNGADPKNPLVSPIFADLHGLPPMLIQVGTAETLLSDSLRLAAVAAEANLRVTLQAWPDMIHAWHLFHPQLTPGRQSLAEAGAFLRAG